VSTRSRQWVRDHIEPMEVPPLAFAGGGYPGGYAPPAAPGRATGMSFAELNEQYALEDMQSERERRRRIKALEDQVYESQLRAQLGGGGTGGRPSEEVALLRQSLAEERSERQALRDEIGKMREQQQQEAMRRLQDTVDGLNKRLEQISAGNTGMGPDGRPLSPMAAFVQAVKEAHTAESEIRGMFGGGDRGEESRGDGLRRVAVNHEIRLRDRELQHEEDELEWKIEDAREQRKHEAQRWRDAFKTAEQVLPDLAEAIFGEKLVGMLPGMGNGTGNGKPSLPARAGARAAGVPAGMRAWRCADAACGAISANPVEDLLVTCQACGQVTELDPVEGAAEESAPPRRLQPPPRLPLPPTMEEEEPGPELLSREEQVAAAMTTTGASGRRSDIPDPGEYDWDTFGAL